MRWIIAARQRNIPGASPSQTERFETNWLEWHPGELFPRVGVYNKRGACEQWIGAKVVGHGRYAAFQMTEVAIPG
jgi:hypothetical protein